MSIWYILLGSLSLFFGVLAGVRHRGNLLERLMLGTGCLVWWPLALGYDLIEVYQVSRADRIRREKRRQLHQ